MTKHIALVPALLASLAVACGGNRSDSSSTVSQADTSAAFTWQIAGPPLSLIPTTSGFCYLTSISGKFDGDAQSVALTVTNGTWTLGGSNAHREDWARVLVSARCSPWSDFTDFASKAHVSAAMNADSQVLDAPDVGLCLFGEAALEDNRSLCYLTALAGDFEGGGESARVNRDPSASKLRMDCADKDNIDDFDHDQKGSATCVSFGNDAPLANITSGTWGQGTPPSQLIGINEGVCMLTGVSGALRGTGERVDVWPDAASGHWFVGGSSGQDGVSATATCVPFNQARKPSPPPLPDPVPNCSATTACGGQVYVGCTSTTASVDMIRLAPDHALVGSFSATPQSPSVPFFTDTPASATASYQVCVAHPHSIFSCSPIMDVTVDYTACPPPPPPPVCPRGQHDCGNGCVPLRVQCQ